MTQTCNTTQQNASAMGQQSNCGCRSYLSAVDIVEKPDEFVVTADVPGAAASDVDVNFEKGVLKIHARVPQRVKAENTRHLLREYGVGDFVRSFELGESIDPAGIAAHVSDGVLTVHLPKGESAKPRRITVQGT